MADKEETMVEPAPPEVEFPSSNPHDSLATVDKPLELGLGIKSTVAKAQNYVVQEEESALPTEGGQFEVKQSPTEESSVNLNISPELPGTIPPAISSNISITTKPAESTRSSAEFSTVPLTASQTSPPSSPARTLHASPIPANGIYTSPLLSQLDSDSLNSPVGEASLLIAKIKRDTMDKSKRSSVDGNAAVIREGVEKLKNRQSMMTHSPSVSVDGFESAVAGGSGSNAWDEHPTVIGEEEEELELAEGDVDWQFWGNVMQDYEGVATAEPERLSKAIQNGIPPVIRGNMWQLMSSSKDPALEKVYSQLLKETSSHEKSIQKDLSRTFPQHRYFQGEGGVGQENLFNVVKAYSLYDPEVGYVQGSAFLVAALLLNMPDEEAFCVLVRLMHSYGLRTSFLPEMPGLQLRLFQFDHLIEEFIPLLHYHFVRNGVKSSMYAGQWFLTMFSYRFPLDLVYRIFDTVFAEGIESVFRFSIALLQKNEEELLKLDFEGILKFLQGKLFDYYKAPIEESDDGKLVDSDDWKANDFVKDAFSVQITPFMLDAFTAEWDELCRAQNSHAIEVDILRTANRNLSTQVKTLEASLTQINAEHVELVNQVVASKLEIEKENERREREKNEIEAELVKYKMLYAELSHLKLEQGQRESFRSSLQAAGMDPSATSTSSKSGDKSPSRRGSDWGIGGVGALFGRGSSSKQAAASQTLSPVSS